MKSVYDDDQCIYKYMYICSVLSCSKEDRAYTSWLHLSSASVEVLASDGWKVANHIL